MKKIFSHPLFYCVFALLGLIGCGLQLWYNSAIPDEKGLMPAWHPATVLTVVLVLLTVVLAVLSSPHIVTPKHPAPVRALGAAMAAVFTALAAWKLLGQQVYLTGALAALASVSSAYVVWARLRKKPVGFWIYALFALLFMFYLISRYQLWSAEPETARYAFKLLALVFMMLVFYQKAAIRLHTGTFLIYHLWSSLALVLSITSLPSAETPMLYLSAGIWLLLDPSPRPVSRTRQEESEQA
jgi:hypothetical protein